MMRFARSIALSDGQSHSIATCMTTRSSSTIEVDLWGTAVFFKDGALGPSLVVLFHRDMVEVNAVKFRQSLRFGVIADDQRNLASQFTDLMTVQQISQTVVLARSQYRHARAVARQGHAPLHLKALGQSGEVRWEVAACRCRSAAGPTPPASEKRFDRDLQNCRPEAHCRYAGQERLRSRP